MLFDQRFYSWRATLNVTKCQNLTVSKRHLLGLCLFVCALLFASTAQLQEIDDIPIKSIKKEEPLEDPIAEEIGNSVEDLKKASLQLNRDLLVLEEELLFPSNTQLTVFLSIDTGEFFQLDSVKLTINDTLVASHLYTTRQQTSLSRGGIQRLYVGNIKSGAHEITAIFNGIGPDKREYKRGATLTVNKDEDPLMLELKIDDSTANMQPEFEIKEWQL